MTELEALRIAEAVLTGSNAEEARETLRLMIAQRETAEADPWRALAQAEATMRAHGEVVLATATAEQVREALNDNGLDDLGAKLKDAEIGLQLEFVRGKWDLPTGFSDWRSDLEWRTAELLAKANGA